mgnify:CR=1 FL=1
MLQLTRRYLRQIDGIFLALCAACSVLSVVTLVSIGHNQLGSINKASVQFIASALGILLALIVSTVVAETGEETPMEELGEKEKKAMYAHYAVAQPY